MEDRKMKKVLGIGVGIVALSLCGVAKADGDYTLKQVIADEAFSLAGAETITFNFTLDGKPNIVGVSFEGFYTGPSGFGGDLRMDITGPSGSFYSVGGYDNPGPFDWDFGSFTGTDVFLEHETEKGDFGPTLAEGDWTISFTLDWASSGGHNWQDVNVWLHQSVVPAPGALALLGLAGLVGTRRRR